MESTLWTDKLAERIREEEAVIVDPIHLEASVDKVLSEEALSPEECEGLSRLAKDSLTGKTFTVGFLRRVNARLAEVYLDVQNAEIKSSIHRTASRTVAAVDDVIFARSTGEAGRVMAVIGTGSPSYNETVKEYQKRYGWKQSLAADNALALYKVVHADGKEELYYDTETTADSSYVRMPETSSEKEAVLVDSTILKEALQLWWNLLPENERALQFSRHGSDLKILDRLQTKLAEEREDSLEETHPLLLTTYAHVKANGLSKKAEADSFHIWYGKGYVIRFSEGDSHPYWVSDSEGTELEDFRTKKEALDWVKSQGKTADLEPEDIPEDFVVRPLKPGEPAKDKATCGNCGLSWDDAISTSWTPAPSARCPFEYFHEEEEGPASAEEIAESFINGNISWVKEQLKGELGLAMEVLEILEQSNSGSAASFKRVMKNAALIKKAAEENAPKEADKKLAVWHLNKMIMPWGPEGADPTAARDFGDLESGNVLIASEEELIKSIEARFGITGWEAVEDEPGRYETNQIENNEGYQDDNGTWIADYSLYVKWYTPAKGE